MGPLFIYELLLIAGFAGLVAMALMGFAHAPGHGHHGGHGQLGGHGHGHLGAGHGHAGGAPAAHGHALPGHGHAAGPAAHGHTVPGHAAQGPSTPGQPAQAGHHGQQGHEDNAAADGNADTGSASGGPMSLLLWAMPFISPLNWFSWFLGAGAAGLVATMAGLSSTWALALALLGALVFNRGVVRPIWNMVFSFASTPAKNLGGCLLQQVEAVTSFNERGEGLVRVTIDGRTEDVLARLTESERASGERIRRGDRLLIEDVDPQKNTCRVFRA